ncbi:MAG: KOW motif-containing protein [Oscillospiraceae bacterium]|jgi:transcriptional antiterminator NusG|nr:KOW motif-containing protein [Oscillospiraceae bacterium]
MIDELSIDDIWIPDVDIDEAYPLPDSREFVYAVLVRATKQHIFTREVPHFFPCKALNPTVTRRKWGHDRSKEFVYNLLPGYVFLFSQEEMQPHLLQDIDGILRVLRYSDGSYALTERDEQLARWLAKYNGKIGMSKAAKVGNKIKVIEGPLRDQLGLVTEVDRRKQRAKISFVFNGASFSSWLDFDWIEE